MKKKITAIALVICLLAVAVIGGTLAYFTDSEKATNTMVIGNVEITMDEWKYTEENGWEQYNDNEFVLYPLENEQGAYLYNKSVRTYNTSPSGDDVYIRSIVLIEANAEATNPIEGGNCCFPGIHFAYDTNDTYTSSYDGTTHYTTVPEKLSETVNIDGKDYWVAIFVEKDGNAIPCGQALSSLHSVYMDKNVTADQVDGWGDDGVQIIAFSQGIQAEGLTHAEAMDALGAVNEANLQTWLAEANVMA